MSLKKYKNPVNNHFIYNDEIRKSTCKVCYFDMAGRHSENLMRHLKRKHPATYAEVMLEKQRRRSTNPNKSGSDSSTLSSMFKFETEPHKLFIKSEKLVFRLDEPGQQQMPMSETFSNDYEDEGSNHTATSPFEGVYIGKEELQVELDQSSGYLNDSCESLSYQDGHLEESPNAITNLQQQSLASINAVFAGSSTNVGSATCSTAAPVVDPINTTVQVPANSDDAFFLQYMGNKFTKYTANTKNTVQFHINRILYKADMGCYDNVDCSKLSDTH